VAATRRNTPPARSPQRGPALLGPMATKDQGGIGTLASACVRSVQTDALIVRDTYRDPFRTSSRHRLLIHEPTSPGDGRADRSRRGSKLYAAMSCPTIWRATRGFARGSDRNWMRSSTRPHANTRPRDSCQGFPVLRPPLRVWSFARWSTRSRCRRTRGRSNLRDVVLGSTAEKILRDSVCAVLAVKPADTASGPGGKVERWWESNQVTDSGRSVRSIPYQRQCSGV